jgi:sugar lactone lactonase YvrE
MFAGSLAVAASTPAPPILDSLDPLPVSLVAPARVATDAQSRIYITDPLAGVIVIADAAGQTLARKTSLGQPVGIAVDAANRVYVGDARTGAVTIFDAQWNPAGQLGQGPREFLLPGHIATLTDGAETTVFVSDGPAHVIKAYRNGVPMGQFGSLGIGPQQFDFPAGIWARPDGTLFVVDQNNDRVQVLDRTGRFLRWFPLQPDPTQTRYAGRAQGIAGDRRGRIYVADTFQGHLRVFDGAGRFLATLGGYGERAFQFQSPGGLAMDGQGHLWVANANNARVDGGCIPDPTVVPSATSVVDGVSVTFSVDPGCAQSWRFQWLRDSKPLTDGGGVSGATQPTLTLMNVTASVTGDYAVALSNASGTVLSDPVRLTVTDRPTIVQAPTDRTAPAGTDVTLGVVASGSPPLSYQWSHNGTALTGETRSELVLARVTAAANGIYTVRIANAAGEIAASARFAVSESPTLNVSLSPASGLAIAWNDPFYRLESAPLVTGPWSPISSPSPFAVPADALARSTAEYFRLVRE